MFAKIYAMARGDTSLRPLDWSVPEYSDAGQAENGVRSKHAFALVLPEGAINSTFASRQISFLEKNVLLISFE